MPRGGPWRDQPRAPNRPCRSGCARPSLSFNLNRLSNFAFRFENPAKIKDMAGALFRRPRNAATCTSSVCFVDPARRMDPRQAATAAEHALELRRRRRRASEPSRGFGGREFFMLSFDLRNDHLNRFAYVAREDLLAGTREVLYCRARRRGPVEKQTMS
jgi:hypothetical protein